MTDTPPRQLFPTCTRCGISIINRHNGVCVNCQLNDERTEAE